MDPSPLMLRDTSMWGLPAGGAPLPPLLTNGCHQVHGIRSGESPSAGDTGERWVWRRQRAAIYACGLLQYAALRRKPRRCRMGGGESHGSNPQGKGGRRAGTDCGDKALAVKDDTVDGG